MSPRATHPGKVLVLHGGALGDCVLTLQLGRAMQACWDQPAVTVAARSPIARWAARHRLIPASRSIDELSLHTLYAAGTPAPDALVDFLLGFDRIVSFLGGPAETVSRRLTEIAGGRVVAVDPRPTPETLRNRLHITEQWAGDVSRQAEPLTMDAVQHEARLSDAPALRAALRSRLDATNQPCVLCHPGAGSLEKSCPIDALRLMLQRLRSDGWAVGWMIGPDELERFGPDFARRLREDAPVIDEESVVAAADLAAGAETFIGNDAGMTHVAALAGVPTTALFGPTDPNVWRPLGVHCWHERCPAPGASFREWANAIVAGLSSRLETGSSPSKE